MKSKTLIFSTYKNKKGKRFFGTHKGLSILNSTGNLSPLARNQLDISVYFIKEFDLDTLLLGTYNGIYLYNFLTEKITKIDPNNELTQTTFHKAFKGKNNKWYFATFKGLLVLTDYLKVKQLTLNFQSSISKRINALYIEDHSIWVGLDFNEIYRYSLNGSLLEIYSLEATKRNLTIHSIIKDSSGLLWISTNDGIFRLDHENKQVKHLTASDGLQDDIFITGSAFKAPSGRLYFGGQSGFNTFQPRDIKDNLIAPKVVLTELRRFNTVVEPYTDVNGLIINKPINYLDTLELGHNDSIISLEFAGLHYADPSRNKYSYKLEGLHKDWIETDASNRTATLTNLSPGDYIFRVKAANKDGVWSREEDGVALKVIVHPAPWLSRWAYTLYAIIFISSIFAFIQYRTRASIQRAQQLEIEVEQRTKEINTQKNVIESLLERKNELFANISHEFRTPLTLILGPLEKELKAMDSPKSPKHLQMIRRNATRLLGMVEQILKLTELKKEEIMQKVPIAVKPALEAIVESFQPLAENKQINLIMQSIDDCNVLASNDAIEVIVGNLISNAIKYTHNNGSITVATEVVKQKIEISVTDTGAGMTNAQQNDIFERFVRLDKTSDIAGTGIGLSIVKELVRAHKGKISVVSVEGQGSTFTIILPLTEKLANVNQPRLESISHLTNVQEKWQENKKPSNIINSHNELANNLLIIEDNSDMQEYIKSTLDDDYNCLIADRGEAGIEIAVSQVPDLIICDVMMPGIDGYEVARRLRDDERTSHIPIVLLTAKGDKDSRIQGWNENIDDYMTKPFDEFELKSRLSNILSIRNILRRKASKQFNNDTASAADKKTDDIKQKVLNQKEQAFVDKLMLIIEENYSEANLQKADLASKMAVSDRQLQRKLKSLIDQNPMDILREYRLKKAASELKDGHQVSHVAEVCGFNSPSHFIYAFKALYNLTPKQYQLQK